MAKRYTYGVVLNKRNWGKDKRGIRWARTNNKAEAIAVAKKQGGAVYAMPYSQGDMTYDAPTFMTLSKKIYDSQ